MPIHKKVNKNFFKKWSRDMAYILGFMYADGNMVVTKRGGYYIAVYSNDKLLLRQMLLCMQSDHKVSQKKKQDKINYRFQIGSKEMFEDLVKIGLTPNKARRMRLPEIPRQFVGDFVRGYFDGDGNVWSGNIHKRRKTQHQSIQVHFTSASHDFLSELQKLLINMRVGPGSIHRIGPSTRLSYSSEDSFLIAEIMYNSGYSLFLSRKRHVFDTFKMKMRP